MCFARFGYPGWHIEKMAQNGRFWTATRCSWSLSTVATLRHSFLCVAPDNQSTWNVSTLLGAHGQSKSPRPFFCVKCTPTQSHLCKFQAPYNWLHQWSAVWPLILPWPKKLRQAGTSNYRRVHAREITRLCPLGRGCPNFFLARVVLCGLTHEISVNCHWRPEYWLMFTFSFETHQKTIFLLISHDTFQRKVIGVRLWRQISKPVPPQNIPIRATSRATGKLAQNSHFPFSEQAEFSSCSS